MSINLCSISLAFRCELDSLLSHVTISSDDAISYEVLKRRTHSTAHIRAEISRSFQWTRRFELSVKYVNWTSIFFFDSRILVYNSQHGIIALFFHNWFYFHFSLLFLELDSLMCLENVNAKQTRMRELLGIRITESVNHSGNSLNSQFVRQRRLKFSREMFRVCLQVLNESKISRWMEWKCWVDGACIRRCLCYCVDSPIWIAARELLTDIDTKKKRV